MFVDTQIKAIEFILKGNFGKYLQKPLVLIFLKFLISLKDLTLIEVQSLLSMVIP